MSAASLRDQLVEFFTLRSAGRFARELSPDARSALAHAVALATQKREAAETLWPRGSTAEALALTRGALDAAAAALESLDAAVAPAPSWYTEAQSLVAGARARAAASSAPEFDADVVPAHDELFRDTVTSLIGIERLTALAVGGPRKVLELRLGRWFGAAVALSVLTYALVRFLHVPTFSRAVASEEINPLEDPARNAIDEDPNTSWFLPDGHPGWIDLALTKPRSVRTVRVAQGNPPWGDRTTKDARIETFLGETLLTGVDVTLPDPPSGEIGWTEVSVGSPVCDRVRFSVKTAHRRGGGLAEIEVR